jgi:hypothetical protein
MRRCAWPFMPSLAEVRKRWRPNEVCTQTGHICSKQIGYSGGLKMARELTTHLSTGIVKANSFCIVQFYFSRWHILTKRNWCYVVLSNSNVSNKIMSNDKRVLRWFAERKKAYAFLSLIKISTLIHVITYKNIAKFSLNPDTPPVGVRCPLQVLGAK